MTTLIAWVSVDEVGVSALNIASDSRFSWADEEIIVRNGIPEIRPRIVSKWDSGKKLFSCRNATDFFGFSGRVVTQSAILSQIVDAIDFGVIKLDDLCPIERHNVIFEIFRSAHQKLDKSNQAAMSFFHGFRENSKSSSIFHLWETSCADGGGFWKNCKINTLQKQSSIIAFSGTGGIQPGNALATIRRKFGSNVSSIFQALNKAIDEGQDPFSGGFIQMMKIDRLDASPQPVGLWREGSRFFLGLDLGVHGAAGSIDWRDKNYTFLNGETLKPRRRAKDQSFRSE